MRREREVVLQGTRLSKFLETVEQVASAVKPAQHESVKPLHVTDLMYLPVRNLTYWLDSHLFRDEPARFQVKSRIRYEFPSWNHHTLPYGLHNETRMQAKQSIAVSETSCALHR